jgi:hypothetical protein
LDDKIKELLKQLGDAINESISASDVVNDQIQRIRDEGYNLYVVLDATIGLNRTDDEEEPAPGGEQPETALVPKSTTSEVQFRIDVNDLTILRSMGIDPTRKVRSTRRIESKRESAD